MPDLFEQVPPRRTTYMLVSKTARAQRNPKTHDLPLIVRSIRRFGFVDGAVHDGRTGRIIAGHGRLEALQQMEAAGETPPDGILEGDDGWLMPVQTGWSSRSDAEAEALLVVHNKATEAGGWDSVELAQMLADLQAAPDPELLTLSGFTAGELERLAKDVGGLGDAFKPEEDAGRLDETAPKDEMECPNCHQMIAVGVKVRGVGRGRKS